MTTSKANLTGKQRYWLWRRMFQTGADTVTASIFPATILLALATYSSVHVGNRKILGAATASMISVFLITPAVMLGADLRKDILDTASEGETDEAAPTLCVWLISMLCGHVVGRHLAENDEEMKKVVGRFQFFHSVRIGLAGLATALAAVAVYQR